MSSAAARRGSNQYARRAGPHRPPAIGPVSLTNQLSTDKRIARAGDLHSSPAMLTALSCDADTMVRWTLAQNPACPRAALRRLAGDHDWRVREEVAKHRQCPSVLLHRLLRDQDLRVAAVAARNPNLPRATLAMWQLTHRSVPEI